MQAVQPSNHTATFGTFEIDFTCRELRKHGIKIRLQEQPFQILELLLEHAGEIVSREDIQKRIWPADTFVDFDKGLYNAVKKLREALGDTAATPRFIETIPKRGYRFIALLNSPAQVIPISLVQSLPRRQRHSKWLTKIGWLAVAACGFAFARAAIWHEDMPKRVIANTRYAALGGAFASTVDQADQRLMAYYRGADTNLYQMVWSWDPSQWSQMTGIHGKPSVAQGSGILSYINTVNHRPEVFYLTQDTQHIEQISVLGFVPADLNAATGAPPAALGSALAGFIDECSMTDNVFYVGSDRHLHLLLWSLGTGWTTQDLTSLTHSQDVLGGKLAALANGFSGEIFYFQSDHHVHELWRWSGCAGRSAFDGWHFADVNKEVGGDLPIAAAESGLTCSYDAVNARHSVFYSDVQNHMQGLFFSDPANWKSVDVTAVSGAPKMGSGTFTSLLNPMTKSESVYFFDANQNVRGITSHLSAPTKWSDAFPKPINILSGQCRGSGAPAAPAAVGSPLASDVNTLVAYEDLYYLGADQDLYQLERVNGVWTCADITRLSGAPRAVP
jgi:DNA-binding winged helix-turn-helix (wHTH) protein